MGKARKHPFLKHKDESDLDRKQPHPQYRVGTQFLRTVPGWGLCEGIVSAYNGESYTVHYPSIELEDLVDTKVLDDATVTTNWNAHLLEEGQHVWACTGKGERN
jgi:hypothetical protein